MKPAFALAASLLALFLATGSATAAKWVVYDPPTGADPEPYIRETATYGVDVKQKDFAFDASQVARWRKLGEIQKLA